MRSALISLVVLFAAFSGQAVAEKRVALVIGNSTYQHAVQLANPSNDSADMTAKLQGLGFEVVSDKNLDLAGMRHTVRAFIEKLDGADMALFFYAGHGVQVNGTNFMVPVDAELSGYNDLDFEALPMDLVQSAMERSAKVNLIFLDACRDNPFAQNLARSMGTRSGSVGRGLARLGSGVGSLIAFATQPGNVALDGAGRNSPFTTALLAHLGTPGQDIVRDLIDVRRDVLAATEGKQVPWENSSLTGEVILKPIQKEQPPPATSSVPPSSAPDNAVELAYWATIKDSTEKAFFEAYLQQYPAGAFAALAELKIQAIDTERKAKASDETVPRELARVEPAPSAAAQLDSSLAVIKDPGAIALATQGELARLGCLAGLADGKWGSGSRKALQDFADRQGVKLASLEPTEELLERLKAVGNRVCPLVCGNGTEVHDNRCVPPANRLSAFDGTWKLVRRATTDCGSWRELHSMLYIHNGIVSSDSGFVGNVSSEGAINIKATFVYEGRRGGNTVTGVIKGDVGTGKFKGTGAGTGCSGKIVVQRM
ncbi:caspase domain-containing protein [Mesorhizobium abyssinicae]|uniref:caspase family protein n=1 Tax=Mesorhizobium abyssinicae TaxID=1209958 RepID=UPI002A24CC15|nr:caspase domain-containing protein [Mesorhizobium abyssinicae]MDX8433294.1 caspase domain-containing protein [Mesorhizobium abyssinicae]